MKRAPISVLKTVIVILTAIQSLLWAPYKAHAFHEGGVGYCEACHALHKTEEDMNRSAGGDDGYLIKGADPSSTCLQCHAEEGKYYNVLSSDGSLYTPGGDFYWLKKTFSWVKDGVMGRSEGDDHGHNIVAADFGLTADTVQNSADVNLYPADALGCTSCHNPHGTISGNDYNSIAVSVSGSYGDSPAPETVAGNYRLLGGVGYSGGRKANGISFNNPAPVAVADRDGWTETDTVHVAYGAGMSEWCGNCHAGMLEGDNKHPAGSSAKLSADIISNYNSYIKSGDVSGTRVNAYLALVPFEWGETDKSLLDPLGTSGPDVNGNANVMCLTCHRAHASAFTHMGRWDFRTTFMEESHPKNGDGGVSGSDVLHSYYGRDMTAEFGRYQRQLCNKCHLQD